MSTTKAIAIVYSALRVIVRHMRNWLYTKHSTATVDFGFDQQRYF